MIEMNKRPGSNYRQDAANWTNSFFFNEVLYISFASHSKNFEKGAMPVILRIHLGRFMQPNGAHIGILIILRLGF